MPEWQREKSLENLQTMENKNTLLTFAFLVFPRIWVTMFSINLKSLNIVLNLVVN